ncbi:hypothetical protein B0O80DRAFT_136097 [Mortierella sp. GBAus27b]|nr:hypothetical protein B0O80DRAFT_136097 [Mortierella sp. GBAus27b]
MAHPASSGQAQRSRPGHGGQHDQRDQVQRVQGQGLGQEHQQQPRPRTAPEQNRRLGPPAFVAPSTSQAQTYGYSQGQGQGHRQGNNTRLGNISRSTPRSVGQQGPGNGANHSNSRNTTTALHLGTPSNTVTSSQFGSSLSVTATDDTNQPPTGFSQAYEDGLSIPTSKFNTAAFGTIRFPTLPTQSATTPAPPTSTATAPVLNQYDPDGIDMCDDLGNFDDDFDDDFMQTEVVVNKNNHGLETGNTMSQTGPPPSQNGSVGSGDISIGEASILKQRLAEMEQQLKSTQEELMIKSGQASVLKDRLDSESQAHGELKERFRVADTQHQTEMESMKEKHQKEISNINMNHQFEVQSYIAARQVNTAAPSSTQSLRNTAPPSPTPQFPKPFSLFPSTQSSIKTQPGRDDGFSVSNFTVTPRSPRKSRTVGLNSNATIERKPRPPQFVPDPSKTVSHFDGLRGDIPTRSDEELIRDKLLAGHENSFGFPNLLVMNKDENQLSPLPADFSRITGIREQCPHREAGRVLSGRSIQFDACC